MKMTHRRFGFRSMKHALLAAMACLRGGTGRRDATRRMAGHIRALVEYDRQTAKACARAIIERASQVVEAASMNQAA